MPGTESTRNFIDAVWRMEQPRVIAGLLRMIRDVSLAEEFAQDAFVAALTQWPLEGTPKNLGAWLMTTARRKAVDHLRRSHRAAAVRDEIGRGLAAASTPDSASDRSLDAPIDDDLLRLLFTTCHPSLSSDARAATTLRLLCGLSVDEVARAFLVPAPTMAQRIARAKRALTHVPDLMELPSREHLPPRLASVLEVIYLLFNEGYAATSGYSLMRPDLCEEALRLGRVLAGLLHNEPEVLGLVALMELQSSRAAARIDAVGAPILLENQDRARWDQLLIRRGLAALERARNRPEPPGFYVLQAAIAACHARAPTFRDTDWNGVADLYQQLAALTASPIVELNRAVAVSMAQGPAAGLAVLEQLVDHPALQSYHLLPAARADMLERLGRSAEAVAEFQRAAGMTRNAQERAILFQRAAGVRL